MKKTQSLTGNSCICEEGDEEFSWVEKELEEKLWELHDRVKIQKILN